MAFRKNNFSLQKNLKDIKIYQINIYYNDFNLKKFCTYIKVLTILTSYANSYNRLLETIITSKN